MAIHNGAKSWEDLGTAFGFEAALLSATEAIKCHTCGVEYYSREVPKTRKFCTFVAAT